MLDSVSYEIEYLTHHRRSLSRLQNGLPRRLIQAKEKYFALAQSWCLTRMVEHLQERKGYDICLIKPGFPYLASLLRANNISTLVVDNQPELIGRLEVECESSYGDFCNDLESLADSSVGISVSHNVLQRFDNEETAFQFVKESMRIASDFAYLQVTDRDNLNYPHDDSHKLALTEEEWRELIQDAISDIANGWSLREVHSPRLFDVLPLSRPPVFFLERGEHTRKNISLDRKTRITRGIYEGLTLANVISATRPVMAHVALSSFISRPELYTFTMGTSFATDALDGWIARKLPPTGFKQGSGAYVDIFADRMVEYEAFWDLANSGDLSFAIPIVYTTKGVLVDTARLVRDARRGDFSNPLSYGNNHSRAERILYGGTKAILISGIPFFNQQVSEALSFLVTVLGVNRSIRSLLNIHRRIDRH